MLLSRRGLGCPSPVCGSFSDSSSSVRSLSSSSVIDEEEDCAELPLGRLVGIMDFNLETWENSTCFPLPLDLDPAAGRVASESAELESLRVRRRVPGGDWAEMEVAGEERDDVRRLTMMS